MNRKKILFFSIAGKFPDAFLKADPPLNYMGFISDQTV